MWVYRLATSIVLMCLSILLFLNQRKNKGGRTQKSIIYGLRGVGLIALLTTSLIGHGAALNPASVPILIDFVHNLSASLWIGGVIYLAFVVVPGIKQSHKDEYIKASLPITSYPKIHDDPCGHSWDYSYHRTVLTIPTRTRPWIDTRIIVWEGVDSKTNTSRCDDRDWSI